jgi:hypothetical protein
VQEDVRAEIKPKELRDSALSYQQNDEALAGFGGFPPLRLPLMI